MITGKFEFVNAKLGIFQIFILLPLESSNARKINFHY